MDGTPTPPSALQRIGLTRWVTLAASALGSAHAPPKLLVGIVAVLLWIQGARWFDPSALDGLTAPALPARSAQWIEHAGPVAAACLDLAAWPVAWVLKPWTWLFQPHTSALGFSLTLAYALYATLAFVVVGACAARMSVVWLTGRDRPPLVSSARNVIGRLPRLLGAALSPLIGIGVLGGICALLGLVFRLPAPVSTALVAVVTPIAALLAIPITWLIFGMAAGFPFTLLSVMTENSDILDALSRSFAYVFRRKVLFLAAWFFGWLAIALGLVAFWLVMSLVFYFARLFLSLGAGAFLEWLGAWAAVSIVLVRAWAFSAFWSLASALYILLRLEIDGTATTFLREAAQDGAPVSSAPATAP